MAALGTRMAVPAAQSQGGGGRSGVRLAWNLSGGEMRTHPHPHTHFTLVHFTSMHASCRPTHGPTPGTYCALCTSSSRCLQFSILGHGGSLGRGCLQAFCRILVTVLIKSCRRTLPRVSHKLMGIVFGSKKKPAHVRVAPWACGLGLAHPRFAPEGARLWQQDYLSGGGTIATTGTTKR